MFGLKELDIKNTYSPDLQDIQESAHRTYGEANSFFRKEELYLADIEKRLRNGELSSREDIYDECHAIASDLAKCCEMYLKALYIFENNIPGNQIDGIWDKLKNSEFQADANGNLIYKTPSGLITFLKYDVNGNPIVDSNGKNIYFDENGNIYNENTRGSKIKRNGHQLDRLIELLSPESRLYLETRMFSIPMSETENNSSVSILDFLQKKGVIEPAEHMTKEQYTGWIEQHKKTFEEARYSGQKQYDVNVEFLHHLATQIKAVVQYRIKPNINQQFTVTDEELSKLPLEIQQMAAFHSNYISEQLIKMVANDDRIRDKIKNIFSQNYTLPDDITPSTFCEMIDLMDVNEIFYTSYICYLFKHYKLLFDKVSNSNNKEAKDLFEIVTLMKQYNLDSEKIARFFCQIKSMFGNKMPINNEGLTLLFSLIRNEIVHGIYNFEQFVNTKILIDEEELDKYNLYNNYKK